MWVYLSAIVCELDLDLCHFDVDPGFVQHELDRDGFLRLSMGSGNRSDTMLRLIKLKQALRLWYTRLTLCLKTLDLEQFLGDSYVFRLVEK